MRVAAAWQIVEFGTHNPLVAGSIPARPTRSFRPTRPPFSPSSSATRPISRSPATRTKGGQSRATVDWVVRRRRGAVQFPGE